MQPCEYPGCRNPGQRHHIVFRSQGGLDIELNYKYLCAEHHTGDKGPHKCRAYDLELKKSVQNKLDYIFDNEYYTLSQIANLIGANKKSIEKRFKTVPNRAGKYNREDIIRKIMGDRIY